MSEITVLLDRARSGDGNAWDEVVEILYSDLKRIARGTLGSAPGNTLGATGLVHECYERLVRSGIDGVRDRSHLLAIAARAMRQILINRARDRVTAKRGGGACHYSYSDDDAARDTEAEDLLAVETAMQALESSDPRLARIVECRVFAGMSEPETAEALQLSLRTVQRLWQVARDALRQNLAELP
ncbi:ECF-type sigma factor [Tahibacter amnicola]|uniref:ECF-type sigma factor n=1 Tax=Tahibacter amnicola TaxID=2976241 RepID=A0ABY6BKB7_9GAMM|nr:ECF-type sigma factor [Tahibacter amnicola]UXI70458.1 ECF-type sigma factor [Tahibacter amnicola]